jgi:serine/threonine-protein phosphatase 2B regulatory subunit
VFKRLPALAADEDQFYLMGFNSIELTYLYDVFCQIDKDGSGELSIREMLDFLDIPRTKFANRVFSIFDEDQSGEIDFKEFVMSMWNYCTLGKSALVLFAFDLYDGDNSGFIDPEEVSTMLKDVYGRRFQTSKMAKKIYMKLTDAAADISKDGGEVNITKFNDFCKRHPALLYPAFVFQTELQVRCMGPAYWHSKAYKRISLAGGKETNVTEFLQAQMDVGAFHDLIVEPFSKNANPTSNPTKDEKRNVNRLMEASGSVAARRAQKEMNKATNVALAAGKFRKKAQEKRAERENGGSSAGGSSSGRDKKIRPSTDAGNSERSQRKTMIDKSSRGKGEGLQRANTQGVLRKNQSQRGLKRSNTQRSAAGQRRK